MKSTYVWSSGRLALGVLYIAGAHYWLLFSWGPLGAFIRILHRGPLTVGSYHFVEVTSHCGVVLFGEKFSLLLAGSFVFPLSCSLI